MNESISFTLIQNEKKIINYFNTAIRVNNFIIKQEQHVQKYFDQLIHRSWKFLLIKSIKNPFIDLNVNYAFHVHVA